MGVENLVVFVQKFFSMLPAIMQILQLVIYVFLIFFFGKIAVKGVRKKVNPTVKYLIIIFTGALCLISSIGLSWIFSFARIPSLEFLQLDSFLAGLFSSGLFALSFYLLTHGMGKDKDLKMIWEEIEAIKKTLIEKNLIKKLTEKQAKKKAEDLLKGEAKEAKLLGDVWEVTVEKGKKHINAIIDAFSGDTKEILYHKSRLMNFFSDKLRIVGMAVFIFLIVLVLLNYKGLPNIHNTLNQMGLTNDLISQIPNMSIESGGKCLDIYTLSREMSKSHTEMYTGNDIKNLVESKTGAKVMSMSKFTYDNKTFVFAMTNNSRMCYTQDGKFCDCYSF